MKKERPINLTCEFMRRPLGLETAHPRFGWTVNTQKRNNYQGAYHILVASNIRNLNENIGDVWDSGEVLSKESINARYQGKKLKDRSIYYWKVRIWDKDNSASQYSKAQEFVTGLSSKSWGANWIWDSSNPHGAQHRYFRKEIIIPPREIERAIAYVSADEYYKLYINGKLVGQGPALCFAEFQYYNTLDITDYLSAGKPNAIAAHVIYSGMGGEDGNYGYTGGDNKMGFILQVEILFSDGERTTLKSDDSWKIFAPSHAGVWGDEEIKGYELPEGWKKINFDDSNWEKAISLGTGPIKGKWDRLISQNIEELKLHEVCPIRFKNKGRGNYFVDFGREAEGYLKVTFHGGKRGDKVLIRFAEELREGKADEIYYPLRCLDKKTSWKKREEQQLIYYLKGANPELFDEQFDYTGFRYVELYHSPPIHREDVHMLVRTLYSEKDDRKSYFSSSSHILNEIWELCKYTMKVGTEEQYFDCPTRERGQYIGDGYIEVLTNFYTYGQVQLTAKFLKNISQDQIVTGNPIVRCCCPLGSFVSVQPRLLDYSLIWVFMTWEYYMQTGDKDALFDIYPGIKKMIDKFYDEVYLKNHWDKTKEGTVLWDWGAEHDDVPVLNTPVGDTLFHCFLFKALKNIAKMADELGYQEEKKVYWTKAEKLKDTVNDLCWTSGYKNGVISETKSLHANVAALISGVVPEERKSTAINIVKDKGLYCGVYFAFFVLQALYSENEDKYALSLLEAPYEGSDSWRKRHRWSHMLAKGATTTWESWDPVEKGNMSLFHPWATSPAVIIASEIMGIKPLEPGYRKILIQPHPATLKKARITVPTVRGSISVGFVNDADKFELDLDIPFNTTARVYLPKFDLSETTIDMDGKKLEGIEERNSVYIDNVKSGAHRLCRMKCFPKKRKG